MENKANLQARLKEAMVARGVRSVDLAQKCKFSSGYISRVLSGDIENPTKYIKTIAEALRVNESWLQFGIGPAERSEQIKIDLYGLFENTITLVGILEVDTAYQHCEAYQCAIQDARYIAITDPNARGSGLFVVATDEGVSIAMRVDDMHEVKWKLAGEQPPKNKSDVKGKVLKLWEVTE